jgi:hypothetical protein
MARGVFNFTLGDAVAAFAKKSGIFSVNVYRIMCPNESQASNSTAIHSCGTVN